MTRRTDATGPGKDHSPGKGRRMILDGGWTSLDGDLVLFDGSAMLHPQELMRILMDSDLYEGGIGLGR